MKSIKVIILTLFTLFNNYLISAQSLPDSNKTKTQFFVGYDLGEMAFNNFQNFAGEVGIKFANDHTLRFVYLNVKLTEAHLSSGFSKVIDGDNVSGHWQGYELLYDIPLYRFKREGRLIYGGLSAGYHENKYQHVQLNESTVHKTTTLGFDLGFRESNIFNVKGLYYNLQIPVRFYLTPLEETQLGSSTVNKSAFEQTISFFIGYQF